MCNGEVYSEYTPVEQNRHKKQSNDQWRQLILNQFAIQIPTVLVIQITNLIFFSGFGRQKRSASFSSFQLPINDKVFYGINLKKLDCFTLLFLFCNPEKYANLLFVRFLTKAACANGLIACAYYQSISKNLLPFYFSKEMNSCPSKEGLLI